MSRIRSNLSEFIKVESKKVYGNKIILKWERVKEEGIEEMEKEWRKFGNTVLGFAREVCDAKMIASKEKKLRKGRNEEIWSDGRSEFVECQGNYQFRQICFYITGRTHSSILQW